MNRREWLRVGGITLAVGACPTWIARAFAQEPQQPQAPHKPSELELALARAKSAGKPLLVLAIPAGDSDRYRRRALFGALLRSADEDLLAGLALVEVVCAKADEVRALDSTADIAALAFVVEQEPQRRVVSVTVALEPAPELALVTDEAELAANRRWLAPLAERLRDAIVGDAEHLEHLVAVNRAQLDSVMRSTVERDLRTGRDVKTERVDSCAAQYYAAMMASSVAREQWRPPLAKAASARLLEHAPAGATWLDPNSGGCGMGPCGTGSVRGPSRRFLYFLTDRS